MSAETIWGILFTIYALSGLLVLGSADNSKRPPNTLPGQLQDWESREKKGNNGLMIWCAGFFTLIAVWALFA